MTYNSSIPENPRNAAERSEVVRILYEEYISLHSVQEVWNSPVTSKPRLEPIFAAGFHGIELAFVMMAQFITDPRHYVETRPRIELIADDIMRQMALVSHDGPAKKDSELEQNSFPTLIHLTNPLSMLFGPSS